MARVTEETKVCNQGIGVLGDDYDRMMQAAMYLTRSMDVLYG